ncbi:MAG: long-chain fatty acid--CoA ligase [Alphaproteobacteria bacterium]|nr:long-chain fatty acid--CoA ligase [Alphaproteobacteria bacterium]
MTARAYDWVTFNARRRGSATAAVDLHSGRRFTYAAFDDRVERAAGFLASHGVLRGDRVAALARNTTDTLELQFACARLGALYLPLNWRLAVPELEYILGDARPSVLLHQPEFAEAVAAVAKSAGVRHRLGLGDGAVDSDYERGLAAGHAASPRPALTHADPWVVMYTSGTTGRPKGAVITHGTILFNIANVMPFTDLSATMVNLIFGPLFHTGALSAYTMPAFYFGATTLVMRAFDAGEVLRRVSDPALGVTHINGAVTMYNMMMQHPSFASADFSRIRCATISGESCPRSLLERYWNEKKLPLQNIYGLTESGPTTTALDRDQAITRLGSVGTTVLNTQVRLVARDGRDVPVGEVGEVWLRGPSVIPGYWNKPPLNPESFTGDWLRTGDAARRDGDGYYFLVDRWKDMYISGGENVYPAEVENVIYQIEGVAEAAVIGVPHARWGESGRAVVVRKSGSSLTEAAIIAHCRDRLAHFKAPASVVFVEGLPRSAGGKVIKPLLRQAHGQAIPA